MRQGVLWPALWREHVRSLWKSRHWSVRVILVFQEGLLWARILTGSIFSWLYLEKKVGLHLASSDAYVNIAGGMKMTEPAIDLGICLAIASSMKDIVIPDKLMAFGEIGLSGEVRAVSMAGQRVQEAKKLGFDTVILPEVCRSSVEKADGD